MCDLCFQRAIRSPPASEPAEEESDEPQWYDECWSIAEERDDELEDES
jgi:hypothetical protein